MPRISDHLHKKGGEGDKGRIEKNILGLKLVGENQIGVLDEALIRGHDLLGDVQLPVVAHDGVQDPEEAARRSRSGLLPLELLCDIAHGHDGLGAGDVAREHHVKVVQVRLLEPFKEVPDLLGGHSCPLPLSVPCVIAYYFLRESVLAKLYL